MSKGMKLTYFDGRGRGEIIRLACAAAKKPLEDVRIEFKDWPALKPKTPLGSIPFFEVGGKTYCQGMAIASYVAREFGLYGSSNLEALEIDMIQQTREDLLVEEAKAAFAPDDAAKAAQMKKLKEEVYPKILGFFTKIVKENPTKSGWAVGKKLSLADLVIHAGTETSLKFAPGVLDSYPELKALRTKVEGVDGIKQYLAKRKDTPM